MYTTTKTTQKLIDGVKRHSTQRTTADGEKVRVYIDYKGNVYITVIDKDGYTIKKDLFVGV